MLRKYSEEIFPLTPVTAHRSLRRHFEEIEYAMRVSGDMVTEQQPLRSAIRWTNTLLARAPLKYPFELLWPNAAYICRSPA